MSGAIDGTGVPTQEVGERKVVHHECVAAGKRFACFERSSQSWSLDAEQRLAVVQVEVSGTLFIAVKVDRDCNGFIVGQGKFVNIVSEVAREVDRVHSSPTHSSASLYSIYNALYSRRGC